MDALSSNQPARSPSSPAPLEGTEWPLADYLGREGALVRVPEDVIATAQFAGGTVSGATGCNRYHAPCPGGVASVLDGTEVTAEFGADGRRLGRRARCDWGLTRRPGDRIYRGTIYREA